MAGLYLPQLRHHLPTLRGSHPAAGMEHASPWRVQRAGHLSLEGYALPLSVYHRVGYGYGRKERLGVWVERVCIDRIPHSDLYDVAQVHYRHPVAPFVTTKPTGEGTGLGLSIAYDIITQQHGGTIEVDSREGEFTEFTIRLPRQ